MTPSSDPARQLLRHTLATVAYRGGKALRGAPDHFASFHIGDKTRTPAQILAHMGDLFDWALSIAQGKQTWHDSTPLPWNAEIERFFTTLREFDDFLASSAPMTCARFLPILPWAHSATAPARFIRRSKDSKNAASSLAGFTLRPVSANVGFFVRPLWASVLSKLGKQERSPVTTSSIA